MIARCRYPSGPPIRVRWSGAVRAAALLLMLIPAAGAGEAAAPADVKVTGRDGAAVIENGLVRVVYDLAKGTFQAENPVTGEAGFSGAFTKLRGGPRGKDQRFAKNWLSLTDAGLSRTWKSLPVNDRLGAGATLEITCAAPGRPALVLGLTLYSGASFVALSAGLDNATAEPFRVWEIVPLAGAAAFPGVEAREDAVFLNGLAGGDMGRAPQRLLQRPGGLFLPGGPDKPLINDKGLYAAEWGRNNVLLTFRAAGRRRSVVMGGLTYTDFMKFVASFPVWETVARDEVGRLVDAGERYLPDDRFYADFSTPDPFEALEKYGRALRAAQNASPNVHDFPTVCGWYAKRNDTAKLVAEMDDAVRSGFLKYARVAVRIVPDTYEKDNEQGWWDEEHWRKFGHYKAPCETSRKFAEAVAARGGLSITYFQVARESADYCKAFPQRLLFNNAKQRPSVCSDFTDPETITHMRKVFAELRAAGIRGVMFDYPDEGWINFIRLGGFEDPRSTAAAAYRNMFRLAKDGLGPDSWVDERVLRDPNSDITLGIVDSQRIIGDTEVISPDMVTSCGLRWYKNRVVVNLDMDAKNLLHGWKRKAAQDKEEKSPAIADRDGRRMLLTMTYVVSGRLLLANSFGKMPPEAVHDMSRTFPCHSAPRSARPLDAFARPGEHPRVYDFAVSPDWHQVTFFNPDFFVEVGLQSGPAAVEHQPKEATVSAPLSGEPAAGALGLDPAGEYYVYDFWNDRFVGKLRGDASLEQTLRPGEARMLSVHRALGRPQFISTDRHLMQGCVDVEKCEWNAGGNSLAGVSRVVEGEPYRVVIAANGWRPRGASASAGTKAAVRVLDAASDLLELSLQPDKGGSVEWSVSFEAKP